MNANRKTTVTITRPISAKGRRKQAKQQTTTTISSSPAPAKRRSRNRSRNSTSLHPLLRDYISCCANPWDCPPVRSGFGTAAPTQVAQAFLRADITVNADGTFSTALLPLMGSGTRSGILFNSSGFASTTWNNYDFINNAMLTQMFETARVVGFGIRVLPMIAATDPPGLLFAASTSLLAEDFYGTSILTPAQAQNLPNVKIGSGRNGAKAVGMPEDYGAFSFDLRTISGINYASASERLLPVAHTVPVISGTGFKAGTLISAEYCLCIEGLPRRSAGAQNMLRGVEMQSASLVNTGTSVDGVLRTLRQALPAATTVAAAVLSPTVFETPTAPPIFSRHSPTRMGAQ